MLSKVLLSILKSSVHANLTALNILNASSVNRLSGEPTVLMTLLFISSYELK
jgi:hypothetical protein